MKGRRKKATTNYQNFWHWLIFGLTASTAVIFFLIYYLLTMAEIGHMSLPRVARVPHLPILKTLPWQRVLRIATYDGSNQAVHPDIVFFDQGFHGHKYYLTFTPYPFSVDRFENPSILASDDGFNFKEERSGLNPLAPQPAAGHNDDPDLFFDELSKQFWIYYLETLRPEKQNLVRLTSYDGIEWNKEKILEYDLVLGDNFILSPALVKYQEKYFLFAANNDGKGIKIGHYESQDGKSWDKNRFIKANIIWPEHFRPWHVDVFSGGGWYYLLVNGNFYPLQDEQDLLVARSRDLENWELRARPLIYHGAFNSRLIYRSTGLADEENLAVWFSYQNYHGRWGIGFKKFKLETLFK